MANNSSASQSTSAAPARKIRPSSSVRSKQCRKPRGLNLPGMGCFDGAPSKAHYRYTKQPPGSEEELMNNSATVQASAVMSKKSCRAMAGKKDDTAMAQVSTQPIRKQKVVNQKFGKQAGWRVSKIPRKQEKSEVGKLRERVERLENGNVEAAKEDSKPVDPTILLATSA